MSDDSLQRDVFDLLNRFSGEDELNSLLSSLGYTFVRRNDGDRRVVWNSWTDPAREALAEPPQKMFRAGSGGEFGVVYCRLRDGNLLVGQERRVISQLQGKNNFTRTLFVFSNAEKSRWHFVNVRHEASEDRRALQRRITIGPEERHRTASERLSKLKLEGNEADRLSALEIQNRHNDAFDVEQVTKKFFEDYTEVYFALQDDLTEQTGDHRWAHDYSLQFINRMMFLYFVQRKRWLGDDPEFMKKFWNAYQISDRPRGSFFDDWLKVLFFEAFNGRFHGGRGYFPPEVSEVLALAPYLNGGLFTENDLDGQHGFEVSDDRFETVLDLLEHYNFTISEDSPLDHDRVLGGRYAFPVMSRFLQQKGGHLTDHRQQGQLLYWYVHSFLWGRYAGSTETVINQDLATIEGANSVDGTVDGADPLGRLIHQLRRSRGDLAVREGDFSGWSQGARFYPLLYLLTRVWGARDWGDGNALSKHLLGKFSSLQLHHIFPKAYLYNHGYDKTEVNALANFAFLTAKTNQELSDRPPLEYFEEVKENQPGALESQWIPMDRDLWRVENYRTFLSARRRLLAEAANRLLEDLLEGQELQGEALSGLAPTGLESTLTKGEASGATLVGVAVSEEDDQKLECAYWAEENSLPTPHIDLAYVDESSGEELAVFDLAWPEGLQPGFSQPVAILLNEPREAEEVANQVGYRFFTTVQEFKEYVEKAFLATV